MLLPPETQFVMDVYQELAAFADEHGLVALTNAERIALLAAWGKAIVDNNGFRFFYEGAYNADDVADALECLGLNGLADAFRRSKQVFENATPPEDIHLRRDWLFQNADKYEAEFEVLNNSVWDVESIDEVLASFMRERMDEFIHVSQELRNR